MRLRILGAKKGLNLGNGIEASRNIISLLHRVTTIQSLNREQLTHFRVNRIWKRHEELTPEDGAKDIRFGQMVTLSVIKTVVFASHSGPFSTQDGTPNGDGHVAYIFTTIAPFGIPRFRVASRVLQKFPNPFNQETCVLC